MECQRRMSPSLWKKSNSEHLVEFLLFANEDTYLLYVVRTSETRKDIIEACKVTDTCDGFNDMYHTMYGGDPQ